MSVEAMATVLHHSKAAGTAKVVLIGIANHAGDGGAWPTVATLAKYARVTERNVQIAIRRLEELGEIRVHIQAGGTRRTQDRYRSNRYDILVACPPDCDRSINHRCDDDQPPTNRGDESDTPHAQTGVTTTTPLKTDRGVDSDASGVSPATPEPSYNHPDTPQPPDTTSPASSTSTCRTHPDGNGTRCRACGTNPKALVAQQRRQTEQERRTAEQQRIREDRERLEQLRAKRRSPEVDAELERVRRQLAGAR